MTAEIRLREITERLEAGKKVAAEKRRHFHAARRLVHNAGGYEAFCVAAVGYASAADDVEDLDDQFIEAQAEAQAEMLRRERENSRFVDGNLPVDQEMNMRASQGDEEARQWVYRNLK